MFFNASLRRNLLFAIDVSREGHVKYLYQRWVNTLLADPVVSFRALIKRAGRVKPSTGEHMDYNN